MKDVGLDCGGVFSIIAAFLANWDLGKGSSPGSLPAEMISSHCLGTVICGKG